MPPRSKEKVCAHFIGIYEEVPGQLSIPHNETVVPRTHLQAAFSQQQSFASFGKTAGRQAEPVSVQDCCKPAKQDVSSRASPCLPHWAPATPQIFHHKLSPRNIPGSSSVSVVSAGCLSLILMMELHSVTFSSARNSSFP